MNRVPSPSADPFREDENTRDPIREDGRSDFRPDSFFEELRGHERQFTGVQNVDPFNIDDIRAKYCPTNGDPKLGKIDNEIDFEWKRWEIVGRQDYGELNYLKAQGWSPVPHSQFPTRFARAGTEGPVVVKDMVLMARPMRLTVQARNEQNKEANRALQVNQKRLAETPDGSAPRVVLTDRTTREAIQIPD